VRDRHALQSKGVVHTSSVRCDVISSELGGQHQAPRYEFSVLSNDAIEFMNSSITVLSQDALYIAKAVA